MTVEQITAEEQEFLELTRTPEFFAILEKLGLLDQFLKVKEQEMKA